MDTNCNVIEDNPTMKKDVTEGVTSDVSVGETVLLNMEIPVTAMTFSLTEVNMDTTTPCVESGDSAKTKDPTTCAVCGDTSVGKFYGAEVCASCKAFFARNSAKLSHVLCSTWMMSSYVAHT